MIKAKYIKSCIRVINKNDGDVVCGGCLCKCEAEYINSAVVDRSKRAKNYVREYESMGEFRAANVYKGIVISTFGKTANLAVCKTLCNEHGAKRWSCTNMA